MRRIGRWGKLSTAVAVTLACAVAAPSPAFASTSITEALREGRASVDIRYRFEHVSQDNELRNATASTVRTLLGYETEDFHGLSLRLELNNTAIVASERYDSGPNGNGRDAFSVVPDPKTTRVNRAHIDYGGVPDTRFRLGNQRITLDNVRFIGNVGFRQQEQTYEGMRLTNTSLPDTTIDYSYVRRVNRIFRDTSDSDIDHHYGNARYDGLGFGSFAGYAYLLDYKGLAPQSSTATIGARFAGGHDLSAETRLTYALELARQTDHGSFEGSYSADYYLLQLGAVVSGVTVRAGYEVLGADEAAGKGFETRLATLHAHNGWADRFLVTPGTGLQDVSLTVSTELGSVLLAAVYHDFRADVGSARYGTELGLRARVSFAEHYALEAKYASYDARDFSVDTDKLWLTAELTF